MPWKTTKQRAIKAKREGKAPTTQAGEFVREQMEKLERGTGNAQSPRQAVAIGLSEARRAGVELPPAPGKRAATKKRAPAKKAAAKKAGKKKTAAARKQSRRRTK
jgi:hypothetical protein